MAGTASILYIYRFIIILTLFQTLSLITKYLKTNINIYFTHIRIKLNFSMLLCKSSKLVQNDIFKKCWDTETWFLNG